MTHNVDNQIVETLLEHKGLRFNGAIQALSNSTMTLTDTSEYLFVFTGTTTGQIFKLPDATTLLVGRTFQLWNSGTQQISVTNNGNTTLLTAGSSHRVTLILIDNSTTNGTWAQEITSGSTLSGVVTINASYTAAANSGRYLEFYPANSSNASPFLILTPSTIVAMSVVCSANSTGTASVYRTSDLATPITGLSLTGASTNSVINLNIALATNDKLAVKISSGSLQKPGVSIYVRG